MNSEKYNPQRDDGQSIVPQRLKRGDTMEYCYVVTCESLDGLGVRVSGECYHEFDDAVEFIRNRNDEPTQDHLNPFIWRGKYFYKIHALTFKP